MATASDGNGPAEEATDVDADMSEAEADLLPSNSLQLLPGGVRGGGWEKEMRQGLLSRRNYLEPVLPVEAVPNQEDRR